MSFLQRLGNLVLEKFLDGWMSFVDTLQTEHVSEHFGKNVPDFYDITRERIVLAFVNSHFATHGTWPSYPNWTEEFFIDAFKELKKISKNLEMGWRNRRASRKCVD